MKFCTRFLLPLLLFSSLGVRAQRPGDVARAYADSLRLLAERHRALTLQTSADEVADDPFVASLLTGGTLSPAVLHRSLSLRGVMSSGLSGYEVTPSGGVMSSGLSGSQVKAGANANNLITSKLRTHNTSETWLVRLYAQRPDLIRGVLSAGPADKVSNVQADEAQKPVQTEQKPNVVPAEVLLPAQPANLDDDLGDADLQIVVRRPNFWTFKGSFGLKFTQAYFSDNWYKGGDNNVAFLANMTVEANYDNQQKIKFDNKLEMKLGFQTMKGDKVHKFRTNADQLRMTNKFRMQAAKHWDYTLMLQTWTQFYPGYHSNDRKVYSDFCSPLEGLLSAGMNWSWSKKKFSVDAAISPIAVKMKYVDRKALRTTFGLHSDESTDWTFGSNITANTKWTICKNVTWTARIYYFTDYKKMQIEWENTFKLKVNDYLNTSLYLYPRFDDSYDDKLQFYELLSVGFDLNF